MSRPCLARGRLRHAVTLGVSLLAALSSVLVQEGVGATSTPAAPGPVSASATVDRISVSVTTPFLPGETFSPSTPGASTQIATYATTNPYQELSVVAVPFGTRPGIDEELPLAQSGGSVAYMAALKTLRISQGATPVAGPTLSAFGISAPSLMSIVSLDLNGTGRTPALILEAVAERASRLWLVRIVRQETASQSDDGTFAASLSQVSLGSSNLTAPTTVSVASSTTAAGTVSSSASPAPVLGPQTGGSVGLPNTSLPQTPSWWSGNCDANNYIKSGPSLSR
jgi:hypothetical protein